VKLRLDVERLQSRDHDLGNVIKKRVFRRPHVSPVRLEFDQVVGVRCNAHCVDGSEIARSLRIKCTATKSFPTITHKPTLKNKNLKSNSDGGVKHRSPPHEFNKPDHRNNLRLLNRNCTRLGREGFAGIQPVKKMRAAESATSSPSPCTRLAVAPRRTFRIRLGRYPYPRKRPL